MNYAEMRELCLMQINQHSIAGTEIAPSYDNQQDYILRIPGLINSAMLEIIKVRPLDAVVPLASLATNKDSTYDEDGTEIPAVDDGMPLLYIMPIDFIELKPAGMLWLHDGRQDNYTGYSWAGDKLWVQLPDRGELFLRYRRQPKLLDARPADEDVIDIDAICLSAIPCYVGAKLVLEEDAFVYAALYNEWLTKLNSLQRSPRAEYNTVQDAYDFTGGDY